MDAVADAAGAELVDRLPDVFGAAGLAGVDPGPKAGRRGFGEDLFIVSAGKALLGPGQVDADEAVFVGDGEVDGLFGGFFAGLAAGDADQPRAHARLAHALVETAVKGVERIRPADARK